MTEPSWYWYATRGLGVVSLIALTAAVVLGISTARRFGGRTGPGFVLATLHRDVSLLAVAVVAGHMVTTILDPFAHITVRDAVVPFGAAYRPVWLGLGVAANEVVAAVVVTSLLRLRIGVRLWRFIHWAAYSSWPMAVFHSLGTGSDARSPWLIGVVSACLTAVVVVLAGRLLVGRPGTLPVRAAAAAATFALIWGGLAWAQTGPFQGDWSARSGTPAAALSKPAVVHPGPGGFSDPLVGVMVRGGGYTQLALRDTVDTALTIAVRSAGPSESLPVLTVSRAGRVLCTEPASAQVTLYTVCGKTRLTISLFGVTAPGATNQISGRLDTSGPLR